MIISCLWGEIIRHKFTNYSSLYRNTTVIDAVATDIGKAAPKPDWASLTLIISKKYLQKTSIKNRANLGYSWRIKCLTFYLAVIKFKIGYSFHYQHVCDNLWYYFNACNVIGMLNLFTMYWWRSDCLTEFYLKC